MKGPKKKAWSAFSQYIRLRDCIETTGTSTHFICCTCKKTLPYEMSQAGHAIGGRNNSILLHPELVHAQCAGCNAFGGQYAAYSIYMIDKYGLEHWRELEFLSRKGSPMKEWQWKEAAEMWKSKFEGLRSLGL